MGGISGHLDGGCYFENVGSSFGEFLLNELGRLTAIIYT
jgi:hypothetical protein